NLDHVTVRYLRLMRLLRLAPAAIKQSFGGGYARRVWRAGLVHDGGERPYGLSCVHSCQRRDFERRFSHLTSPRLPATAMIYRAPIFRNQHSAAPLPLEASLPS